MSEPVVDLMAALKESVERAKEARRAEPCGCYACIGNQPVREGSWLTVGMTRMIVCATCGNKRCPHGTDHRNACTGSNEPGQDGSRYTAIPTQPAESSTPRLKEQVDE